MNAQRLLALSAFCLALLAPIEAFAQTTIRVLFVFTPTAMQTLGLYGDHMMQFSGRNIKEANLVLAASGATFVLENAGTYNNIYNPNARSITDTTAWASNPALFGPGPWDIGSVKMARTNQAVNLRRNLANADLVMIVDEKFLPLLPNGEAWPDGDRTAGFSGEICGSNANAYLGVNASGVYNYSDVFVHEVAHFLCAQHADGWAQNKGGYPDNCEQRFDVMTPRGLPFPIPQVSWFAPAVLSGAAHGHGTGADSAFADMTSHCPDVGTAAYDFACVQTSACVLNQSQDAASCPFYTTQTSKIPPFSIWQSGPSVGGSNKVTSTGQCINKLTARRFTKNGGLYNGLPFGDATHDSIGKMNARALIVAAFR